MALPQPNFPRGLDHMNPAANQAQLGSTLQDVIAAFNDLRAKYVALLAKLDTASVASGTNAAQCSPTVSALVALGSRTPIA